MNEEEAVNKVNDQNQDDDEMISQADEFKDMRQGATEIPQFDLAEEIMAAQRKIAATRRKGPARRIEAAKPEKSEPIIPVVEIFSPSYEEEEVIVEIVARDIRQLCAPRGWSMDIDISRKK